MVLSLVVTLTSEVDMFVLLRLQLFIHFRKHNVLWSNRRIQYSIGIVERTEGVVVVVELCTVQT